MPWLPDWLTGYDAANAAAANAAQAELERRRRAAIEAGDQSQADYYNRGLNTGGTADWYEDRAAIDDTFTTAVRDNAAALPGTIRGAVGGVVWGALRSVPVIVWILAAAALFFYMGGASLLKGRLSK